MIAESLFGSSYLTTLKRAVSAYALRHRVVSDNLANVATPGYRARAVEFEDHLQGEVGSRRIAGRTTHAGHLPIGQRAVPDPARTVTLPQEHDNGVNDVDVDHEMGELVKNELAYRLATRLLSRQYQGIRTAITGDRR